MANRKLGKRQEKVLDALKNSKGWHEYCGWTWGDKHTTARIMESLVRAGVAKKAPHKTPHGLVDRYEAL